MTWSVLTIIYIAIYLAIGLLITRIANAGHKRRYGKGVEWWIQPLGIVGWPIIFLIAGRKN